MVKIKIEIIVPTRYLLMHDELASPGLVRETIAHALNLPASHIKVK